VPVRSWPAVPWDFSRIRPAGTGRSGGRPCPSELDWPSLANRPCASRTLRAGLYFHSPAPRILPPARSSPQPWPSARHRWAAGSYRALNHAGIDINAGFQFAWTEANGVYASLPGSLRTGRSQRSDTGMCPPGNVPGKEACTAAGRIHSEKTNNCCACQADDL
jgi:hypothetical protein